MIGAHRTDMANTGPRAQVTGVIPHQAMNAARDIRFVTAPDGTQLATARYGAGPPHAIPSGCAT